MPPATGRAPAQSTSEFCLVHACARGSRPSPASNAAPLRDLQRRCSSNVPPRASPIERMSGGRQRLGVRGDPETAHRRSRAQTLRPQKDWPRTLIRPSPDSKTSAERGQRRPDHRRQSQKRHINEGETRLLWHKQYYAILLDSARRKPRATPKPGIASGPGRSREPLPREPNTPQYRHARTGGDAICHRGSAPSERE